MEERIKEIFTKRLNQLLKCRYSSIEELNKAIGEQVFAILRELDEEHGEQKAVEIAADLARHEEIVLAAKAVREGAIDFLEKKSLEPKYCVPERNDAIGL